MLQMTNQEKNGVKHIIKTIWNLKLEKYQGVSKWRILDQNSDFHLLSRQSVLASCHLGWCTTGPGKDCKGDQLTHFPIMPLHISYSVFQTIPLSFFQTQLHGEEKDGSRNYLCLKAVQMENQMKMLSCELGLGAPPPLHFVILQQHPGWQNPEYSHCPPMTSRERTEFQANHHHFCFVFWKRVSLCSKERPTQHTAQAGFRFSTPLASASWALVRGVWVIMPINYSHF